MITSRILQAAARSFLGIAVPATVAVAGMASDPAAALVYEQYKTNSCAHSLCILDFASAPSGKQLQITSESCQYGTTTQASKIVDAEFEVVNNADNSQVGLVDFMSPILKTSTSTLGNIYVADNTTFFIVPVGAVHVRARMSVSVNNGASISCRISGNIVAP